MPDAAPPWLDRLAGPLHAGLAVLAMALVLGSPWLSMVSRFKAGAPWTDGLHVLAGAAVACLLAPYAVQTLRRGRWRLYYPWLVGDLAPLRQDLQALARGGVPGSEGGGLFAILQGTLLLALAAAAGTGLMWWFSQGSEAVLAWHEQHVLAGRVAAVLLLTHLLTAAAHLLDFIRD